MLYFYSKARIPPSQNRDLPTATAKMPQKISARYTRHRNPYFITANVGTLISARNISRGDAQGAENPMQTFLRSEIDRCQRHNPVHTRHTSAALAEHDIESGEPQAAAGRLGATRGDDRHIFSRTILHKLDDASQPPRTSSHWKPRIHREDTALLPTRRRHPVPRAGPTRPR
jgi:hypothetical protein